MASLNLETTIGQLVTDRPGRARIFESFGIDYCCGGKKPLRDAIREKNLDERTVLGVLEAFESTGPVNEPDYSGITLSALANHIEETHHAYLKKELPRLEFMANKVAARHGDRRPELIQLSQVFNAFKLELESHMHKEEAVLFPMCRQLERAQTAPQFHCGTVQNPIAVMVREHEDAGEALQRMRELTDGFTPPADACNTYRALFAGLEELEFDMHRHVHKENSILFPKAVEKEAQLAGG